MPLGSTDPSDLVPGKRFCFLGKAYNSCYIELETVLGRLNAAVRKHDYDALVHNAHAQLFSIWDAKADLTTIPTLMLVDPSRYKTFAEWDSAFLERWAQICGVIDDAKPSLPFNTFSRFIQPAADQISLVFTPSTDTSPVFSVALLQRIFGVS